MKKILSIFLAIMLLCSLTACDLLDNVLPKDTDSQFETQILGKWEFQTIDFALEFYEDHTGKMISVEDPSQYAVIRWSYNSDADVYHIYVQGKAYVYYATIDYDGNLTYNGETGKKAE